MASHQLIDVFFFFFKLDPVLGLNFGPQIRKKGAHPN